MAALLSRLSITVVTLSQSSLLVPLIQCGGTQLAYTAHQILPISYEEIIGTVQALLNTNYMLFLHG